MDVPTALDDDKGEIQCYDNSSITSDSAPSSDVDDSFSDVSPTIVRIHLYADIKDNNCVL